MDSGTNGQHMTDLQHFWNNPQAQHLFQQITAQRNFETHQTGLCLTQGQYISIPPPGPPAHNYPPPYTAVLAFTTPGFPLPSTLHTWTIQPYTELAMA